MLTIPSTHLVVIAFDDSMGRIMKYYNEWGRTNQMSLIIGADIANIDALINYYLPKPAIDRTTIRMNELLKKRYDSPKEETISSKSNPKDEKGENIDDLTPYKC